MSPMTTEEIADLNGERVPDQPTAITDTETLRSLSKDVCPVCMCTFSSPLRLHCGHYICNECLKRMRQYNCNNLCPLCRAKLAPVPDIVNSDAVTLWARAERKSGIWHQNP